MDELPDAFLRRYYQGIATMVIQGELYLLFNLTVDYFVLWAAGSWTGETARPMRLLAASLIGAAYAILMLLPGYRVLMIFPIKISLPVLMVLTAYGWPGRRRFGRLVGAVFLIYFAAGGASLALALAPWQSDSGPIARGVYWLRKANLTPIAIIGAIALTRVLGGLMTARAARFRSLVSAAVSVEGKTVHLAVLIDTGSHLTEPISGSPVLAAGLPDVEELLPEMFKTALKAGRVSAGAPWLSALEAASAVGWADRIRLIPYRGAGVEGGIMLGFRPDRLILTQKGRPVAARAAIVGILPDRVDPDRAYQAICPPELILDH